MYWKERACMDEITILEKTFGGRWCGITFDNDSNDGNPGRKPAYPLSFCEAVAKAKKGTIEITPEMMDCPGGRRSLGWENDEEGLIASIARETQFERETVRSILAKTPKLDSTVTSITVGTDVTADVVLSFAQPEAIMKLIREWQNVYGTLASVETSGFLSVCGMVAVKAFVTGELAISFGCPNSRRDSGIGRDRLIVGIPRKEITKLCENVKARMAVPR
jgi:uncharacterized protein (DUF169 family)